MLKRGYTHYEQRYNALVWTVGSYSGRCAVRCQVSQDINSTDGYRCAQRHPSRSMSGDYSLPDVLERIYHNQLALEAAVMELTLWVEHRGSAEVGGNVRSALEAIGENAGHIKQGLARLKGIDLR